MKHLHQVFLAAICLLAASCANVTSKHVIGETPAKLDPKAWNGDWGTSDGHTIVARVKSAEKGLLEVAWLEVKDDEIKHQQVEIYITEAGGWLWASFREADDAKANKPYTIARLSEPDEHLLAWTFLPLAVAARVKSGELKGEVLKDKEGKETKEVALDSLNNAQLQSIKDGKMGEVFDWGKPALVLHRLKD